MGLMSLSEAFEEAEKRFGKGAFAGKYDIATDGSHKCEVGKYEHGTVVIRGTCATFEEAFANAKEVK